MKVHPVVFFFVSVAVIVLFVVLGALFYRGLHTWSIYIVVGPAFAVRYLSARPAADDSFHARSAARRPDPRHARQHRGRPVGVRHRHLARFGHDADQRRHRAPRPAANSTGNRIVLIVLITLIATASVVSGLDAVIRRLSEINMLLGFALVTQAVLFCLFPPQKKLSSWNFSRAAGSIGQSQCRLHTTGSWARPPDTASTRRSWA